MARQWGFETVNSTLSVAADDKLLAASCAGIASVVLGMELSQAVAIGVTAVLGSSAVKVGMASWRRSIDQSTNAVSFLVEVMDASRDPKRQLPKDVAVSSIGSKPPVFLTIGLAPEAKHDSSAKEPTLTYRSPFYLGENPHDPPYCPRCYEADGKPAQLTLEFADPPVYRCQACLWSMSLNFKTEL